MMPLQFRATKNDIVSYFDICLDSIKDQLIKEIIIGPKCNLSDFDVKILMYACDYVADGVVIRKTSASYR